MKKLTETKRNRKKKNSKKKSKKKQKEKKQKEKKQQKKTRILSKKYNFYGGGGGGGGGGIFSFLESDLEAAVAPNAYEVYTGNPPIEMVPIILYQSTNDSSELCSQIMQLMSANKTFVRVPQSITHLLKDDFVEEHNISGIPCGYSSLLIPGWYETYGQTQIAELYVRYKDEKIIDDDSVGSGCGLKNYIWPADALGTIVPNTTQVIMFDSFMGLQLQGIRLSSFMEYIYNPKNDILTSEEKTTYKMYYDDKDLLIGEFVEKYRRDKTKCAELCELVKNCFKTYSKLVQFVTTICRYTTSQFTKSSEYEWNTKLTYKDAQELCMYHGRYTETLLPEYRKLVGLYIHSKNFGSMKKDQYDKYMADAITKATILNKTLFCLEERYKSLPPMTPA